MQVTQEHKRNLSISWMEEGSACQLLSILSRHCALMYWVVTSDDSSGWTWTFQVSTRWEVWCLETLWFSGECVKSWDKFLYRNIWDSQERENKRKKAPVEALWRVFLYGDERYIEMPKQDIVFGASRHLDWLRVSTLPLSTLRTHESNHSYNGNFELPQ